MTDKSLGEENYENFARRYAKIAADKPHNAHYNKPAIVSLLPDDLQGKRVLDAGCGPGFFTEILLERGAEVVACDVTPDFLAITRERVGDAATLHLADIAQPLTFADDNTFDLVLSSLVLDYIEDLAPVFAEFYRVLKAGGTLIVSQGHPHADWEYVKQRIAPQEPERDWNYFNVEQFTAKWHGFGEPVPEITSYRRPLSALLNPLVKSGLLLDHVHEPQPTQDYQARSPESYERYMREPGFIVIRARKPTL